MWFSSPKERMRNLLLGLFEPFISHLKFARDQISKGGYSITLQQPAPGTPWAGSPKLPLRDLCALLAHLQFLKRFVTIESEILQIERSIQAKELKAHVNGELKTKDGIIQEENSKIQPQWLLEAWKALLQKEQAKAYRGLVAGFAMENMEDLISFADAFGASRLRQACINLKELCKKKHAERLWMEEFDAVEACSPSELPLSGTSGVVLANGISIRNPSIMLSFPINGASNGDDAPNESSDAPKPDPPFPGAANCKKDADENLPAQDQTPSTVTKDQVSKQWPNQITQNMYNLQGQLSPYQGYPFHPMQPVPLPYLINMQWPPNRNQNSSSRQKKKFPNGKGLEYSEVERPLESSCSGSGNDSSLDVQQEDRRQSLQDPSYRKKNRKKSSGTVVIRNINCITLKRRSREKGQVSDGS